jgi:hypothetical protein
VVLVLFFTVLEVIYWLLCVDLKLLQNNALTNHSFIFNVLLFSFVNVPTTTTKKVDSSPILPYWGNFQTIPTWLYIETIDLYSISFLSIKTKMNIPLNACSQMITVGLIVEITYCIAFGVCFTWTWKHVLRSLWRRWVSHLHLHKRHFIWEISELLSFFYSNIK